MNNKKAKHTWAVLFGLSVFLSALLPARAATYYLAESKSGVAADFGDPATYGLESGLPGAGDRISVTNNLVVRVTDDNIASLSARGTQVYLATDARAEIDLENDAVLTAEFVYSGSANCAGVIKTGAGALTLNATESPTYDSGNRFVGLNNRWHIQGGTVIFPQSGITGATSITLLDIDAGCTAVNVNGTLSTVLTGWGNFEHRGSAAPRLTLNGLTDFHGNILENDSGHIQIYAGSGSCLYGTGTTAYSTPTCVGGLLGLAMFGTSVGSSSLGTSTKLTIQDDSHLLNLGTADETTSRQFVLSSAVRTLEVDGGAYGGVTFTGAWNLPSAIMRSLVLSGSNTEHACVLNNTLADSGDCSYHIVKRGPGVWRMAAADPKWGGAMTVEEGTLQFDSIASAGTASSLGYATNLYANVPGAKDPANKVDWAVKLGNSGDGEEATLEYAGSGAATWPTNRPIAVSGRARFRNASSAPFRLQGVSALSAGSVLTVEGSDAATTNVLNGVADGAGTLQLVKDGEDALSVCGTVDLAGGVAVNGGAVEIQNRTKFNWFKVIVKQTFDAAGGSTAAGRVMLQEFALYDVNGVRQNLNPVIGVAQVGVNAGTLAAGGLAYGPCAAGEEKKPLVNMTLSDTDNNWSYATTAATDPDDPSTWVSFVIRVPEGKPEIEKFDMRFHAKTEGKTENYYSPRIVEIVGGTDGTTWTSLVTVTNEALTSSYYYWLYGDKARYSAARDPANSGRAFDRRAVADVAPDVSIAGNLSVASGASLAIRGDPLTIDRLEIDFAAGVGSYDNFALADAGTIVVKNVPSGSVTIPADFSGVTNLSAASDWTVVDENGNPFRKRVVISSDSVSVKAPGGVIIIR